MFRKWFKKGRQDDELTKKVERMEQLLEKLTDKDKIEIHVHQLHVDGPLTENLTYEMDKIDIDTLSGSLNLGNNFGVDLFTNSKTNAKQDTNNNQSKPKAKFTSNAKGFSYHYNRDDKEVT